MRSANSVALCAVQIALMLMVSLFSIPVFSAPLKLNHEDFSVSSEVSRWCGKVVRLKVETGNPNKVFNPPDSTYLQVNLLGKVRAIASFNCSEIEKFIFTGWSRGKLYYAASAQKSSGWQLLGIFAPP